MFNSTLGRTKEEGEGEGEGEGERVDAIPPKVFSEISRVKHQHLTFLVTLYLSRTFGVKFSDGQFL